jgi:PIN domain nuclease of toxin-antitoxin system
VRVLLDTHYVLWFTVLADRLTPAELAIADQHELVASAVSLWELRIKWDTMDRTGNRKGPTDPVDVAEGLARLGVEILPLTARQACTRLNHPIAHRDPFDEQLLIHAQSLGAQLLTRDRALLDHPLAFRVD